MQIDEVLERLGGVAGAATLRRLTSRSEVRRALRSGRIVRDARGRYALPGADEDLRAANRLSGVLWLDSAARLHGWKLKQRPGPPAVAVPRNRKVAPERRTGIRLRYQDYPPDDVDGFVTGPVRTVLDCCAFLPYDEAIAVADSALRARDVTEHGLVQGAERLPDRYRAKVLGVVSRADGRADNPFESVLRAISHGVPGLQLRPQVWVQDIGRADLVDRRLRLVVEAESFEFHGRRRQLVRDCERYNAFVLAGFVVLRFSWEHVMLRPDYVRAVLESYVALSEGRALTPSLRRLAG